MASTKFDPATLPQLPGEYLRPPAALELSEDASPQERLDEAIARTVRASISKTSTP